MKNELQSSTIRTAWVSIIGGIVIGARALGWDVPEGWTDPIITLCTAVSMIVIGFLVRRGRLKAEDKVYSLFGGDK